jgi:hypothetical protein
VEIEWPDWQIDPLVGVRSEAEGIIHAPLRWRERSDRQNNDSK